jgi:hypothetical protein
MGFKPTGLQDRDSCAQRALLFRNWNCSWRMVPFFHLWFVLRVKAAFAGTVFGDVFSQCCARGIDDGVHYALSWAGD